ncbi:MAG: carbohydrate-binding domain-containing protein, partial [Clostridia bacterium]|nr:carbohydrate-binding domain-containing protein [Clostridia bacterium]
MKIPIAFLKKTGRRCLVAVMTLVMILSAVPFGAAAETGSYNLYVGNTEVTSANLSGEGWSFAPGTNTLTLDGFDYNGTGNGFTSNVLVAASTVNANAAIIWTGGGTLNLVLKNSNKAALIESGDYSVGFYSESPVDITGGGTLELSVEAGAAALTSNSESYGIFCGSGLTVNGGALTAAGGPARSSYGMKARSKITLNGGAVLTALGGTASAYGGQFGADSYGLVTPALTVNDGFVTARGGKSDAVSSGYYIPTTYLTLSGGRFEFSGGEAASSYGLHSMLGCSVSIGADVGSFTAYGNTAAAYRVNITSSVHGKGWTDAAGTEGMVKLDPGAVDPSSFKRVGFLEEYDLWIGDVQVTSVNCADIPGVLGEGAKAEYDPDTGTLTLINVKGVTGVAPRYVNDALIAFKGDLTIRLVGENSLVCDDDVIAIMAIDGSLTVEGEGSLKVDSNFIAVKVKKDLNLNGGTLDFSANREISGMYTVLSAYGLIYSGGALSVDGGVLKAELDLWTDPILYSKTDAVKAYDISIAKGEIDVKVIASTAGKQAIVNALKALNNVTVTGGKVTVDAPLCENGIYACNQNYLQSGGTVASSAAEALFASNTFTISGGEITLTATGDDEYSCGLSTNKGIFFLDGTKKVSVTSENGVPVKGFRNGNGPITVDDKLFISVPEGGSTGQNKWGDPIIVDANGDPAKTVEIIPVVEYGLWVGETRVTNANCRSIPGVTGDGAKAEYDPATQTLTFTGVTGVTGKYNGSGVYAEDISLTVKGNAVIDGDYNNGIYVTGSAVGSAGLTLDGELTFRGADVGINCDGDITVAGGHVKALPYSRLSYQKEMTGVIASGKVTVTGGTLEAKGNYNKEAIISDPGGEIIIPDTHYIRAPFGGSVKVTDNNGHPCAFIVNGEGKTASVVIIKPKVYYNITLDAGDHGAVTVPDKALAGEPISPTIEPDDDYVIALVSLAYGMVENVLYDKNHGDMLPVEFIMPDSDVTLKVGFSEKIYTGLASLTVSEGTLDPVFKTKILSYTDTVGCGVGEVEVSFDVTGGHQLQLDETQFKEGTLTYRYANSNYPSIPTGATAAVELKAAETVLKIKTLPINGQLIPTEYAVTFSRSVHSLTHMPKVDPGCETAGTEEYWKCSVCNKLFSDKDGTNKIEAPAAIDKLGHSFTVTDHSDKYRKTPATCTEAAVYYKS